MPMLKRFFVAVVAVSLLVSAIGNVTPTSAQIPRPAQDVNVVNTPTVQAQQAGPWTVGAQLAPGTTVGISGTPTVAIGGTPTVNVASLPAAPLAVRPALPAFPRFWQVVLTDAQPIVLIQGDAGVRAIGLTSISFTNFAQFEDQVDLAGWGAENPHATFLVQARATLHLTYPTPLVFACTGGLTCMSVRTGYVLNGSSVHVTLNGFVQD